MRSPDEALDDFLARAKAANLPLPRMTEDDPLDPARMGLDPAIEDDVKTLRAYPTQEPATTPPMNRLWRDADGAVHETPYTPDEVETFRRQRKHRAMAEAGFLPQGMPEPEIAAVPAVADPSRPPIPVRGTAELEKQLGEQLAAAIEAYRAQHPDGPAMAERARENIYTLAKSDPQSAKRAVGSVVAPTGEEALSLVSGEKVSPTETQSLAIDGQSRALSVDGETSETIEADDRNEGTEPAPENAAPNESEWADESFEDDWDETAFTSDAADMNPDGSDDDEATDEAEFVAFLEDIERGAFDGEQSFDFSEEERAFIDAYGKAFAEHARGTNPDSVDAETLEQWRDAAVSEANAAVFGDDAEEGHLPSFGSMALLDTENARLAAEQRTSPNVIDGDGNYTYTRAPDAVQARLLETGTLADSKKYVALYDPATGQMTAWQRDPENAEGWAPGLARILSGGMVIGRGVKNLATGSRLARMAARSARTATGFGKVRRVVEANRKFGAWVDEVKAAQTAHASGQAFSKPVTPAGEGRAHQQEGPEFS